MSLVLEIPDQISQAMRLPLVDQQQQLMLELAVALYARGILSLGKSSELTALNKVEFGQLIGKRGIPRHYTIHDLEDDKEYAHS